MSEDDGFEGHQPRTCGEHRTVGHRAWCYDCSEWCYPDYGCIQCRVVQVGARLNAALKAVYANTGPSPVLVEIRAAMALLGIEEDVPE